MQLLWDSNPQSSIRDFAECVFMVEDVGFEPRFKLPKLACYHYTTSSILVPGTGLEPISSDYQSLVLTNYTIPAFEDEVLISYLYYIIFFYKNQIRFSILPKLNLLARNFYINSKNQKKLPFELELNLD